MGRRRQSFNIDTYILEKGNERVIRGVSSIMDDPVSTRRADKVITIDIFIAT